MCKVPKLIIPQKCVKMWRNEVLQLDRQQADICAIGMADTAMMSQHGHKCMHVLQALLPYKEKD